MGQRGAIKTYSEKNSHVLEGFIHTEKIYKLGYFIVDKKRN